MSIEFYSAAEIKWAKDISESTWFKMKSMRNEQPNDLSSFELCLPAGASA
jgi:hypothetical protein